MTKSKDARALLEKLGSDFAASDKRSCRDCLRSKAVPSPKVMSILQSPEVSSWTSQAVLVEAQSQILQILQTLAAETTTTALSHMDTVATAIGLTQLLLYSPQISKQREPLADQASNTVPVAVSPDRLDQLVHFLLASIVQAVSALLVQGKSRSESDDDDMEESEDLMTMDASCAQSDARPVVCFAFVSISRLFQLCKRRQQWMISLCRSLCDLALAAQKAGAGLPKSLLEDAIRSLTKLLEEGTMVLLNDAASRWMMAPSAQQSVLAVDHHTFFAKFVSFLMARIITLLSFLPILEDGAVASSKSASLTSLWKILTTLRGLPLVIRRTATQRDANDASLLSNYNAIANKMEKQLLKVFMPSNSGILHVTLVQALLQTIKAKRNDATSASRDNPVQNLMQNGRFLGRGLLLQRLLQKLSNHTTGLSIAECDILLKLCEIYHSTVLPQCFGLLAATTCGQAIETDTEAFSLGSFLSNSLHCMTVLVLRVEAALLAADTTKLSQLYRLMIQWMAPTTVSAETSETSWDVDGFQITRHPLSNEFVLSLIALFLLASSSREEPSPMALLMVKLLFDARTTTELRCNISLVLVRILAPSRRSSDRFSLVATMIENEFAEHWKEFSASPSTVTKRKRKRRDSFAKPVAFEVYNHQDVEAVGRVLSQLPRQQSKLLRGAVHALAQGDALKNLGHKRVAVQLKSISLLLWYMQPELLGNEEPMLSNGSKNSMLQKLVDHVTIQLKAHARSDKCFIGYTSLCQATLNVCQSLCDNVSSGSSVPIQELCRLIAECIANVTWKDSRDANSDNTSLLWHRILMGSIALLGSMGKAIPDVCPPMTLVTIRDIFHQMFTVQDRAILAPTLDALANFGHSLSDAHVNCLGTFLPEDRMLLFQARGQGMIFRNSQHCEIDNSTDSFQKLGSALARWIRSRPLEKSIFPALSSLHIAPGSYFLQMPTQGGRQALVIFPPGEQSLEDIRHMYELQGDEQLPQMQCLKRVVLSASNGEEGCKCILSD